jgi:hypothetical protein
VGRSRDRSRSRSAAARLPLRRLLPLLLLAACPGPTGDDDASGVELTCYYDGDGDGYGYPGPTVIAFDTCGENLTDVPGDCDDSRDDFNPDAVDVIGDGFDQDCSGADTVMCFVDADGDGYGLDAAAPDPDGSCEDDGQAFIGGDCDDTDPSIHPGGAETPGDGVDEDCNGVDAAACHYDGDGDGYGWPGVYVDLDGDCDDDPLQSADGSDCDDSRADIFPGAQELVGDGIDQDCNGTDSVLCYEDGDGDGWGSAAGAFVDPDGDCTDDAGQSPYGNDCDDNAFAVNPGVGEIVDDGVDQDCDGGDSVTCFYDGDGDGFGWPGTFVDPDGDCTDDPNQSDVGTDCDDSLANVYPGATEVLGDGIDQDCAGPPN